MEHRLKTLPEYFYEVASGRKSFEVRKDDREPPFAPGDTLLLEEYIEGKYTGRWIQADVTLVLRNEYCKEGYCVMAVVPTGGNGLRPLTNFDRLTASKEALARVLTPLMPTMEGFCPFGRHWKNGACECNPNWQCEECMRDWLSQPAEED